MENNYLNLRQNGSSDFNQCSLLELEYIKSGESVDMLYCMSGAPGAQDFRLGPDSKAGSYEPLPEGIWHIGDIVWADGVDNYYGDIWSTAIGPVTIPIEYKGPEWTERSSIEIHLDWNKNWAPGTAGCIGLYDISDMRCVVSWLRDADPRTLKVDWGLGTFN